MNFSIMKQLSQKIYVSVISFFILMTIAGCNGGSFQTGVIKDLNTGLKAVYNGLKPDQVFLLQNNEELTRNDIVLGESFILVNNNTSGLVKKDGTVSVGCSLVLKDENGTELMNEPDLFKGEDVLKESETTVLRCTINTGKPMEVGKNYLITVTFWDKYGKGNIVNTVTVKMRDES